MLAFARTIPTPRKIRPCIVCSINPRWCGFAIRTLLFLGFRIRLRQPFIPHQMEIVRNENVGGLQILIVCRVGLQIQHNGAYSLILF